MRETAGRMLEAAGYGVLTACDGVEGMEVFQRIARHVCAVLLDLTMPNQSGQETFQQIRDADREVPVVLISGYDPDDVSSRFPEGALAGFVRKPFLPDVLVGAIDRAAGA